VNLGKKGQAAKPDEIEEHDFQKGTAMTMNKEAAKANNLYLRAALATLMALALAASLLARIAGPAEAAFPGQNGKIVFASNRATLITNPRATSRSTR